MNPPLSPSVCFRTLAMLSVCAGGLGWPLAGLAKDQDDSLFGLRPTTTTWRVTSETWKLPNNEKMGMVGGNLLFDVADNVKLGLASYGAVRGERGGFITLGMTGEVQQRLSPSLLGHVGLFVGAGSGRSSLALAGGGLMVRSDVGLIYEAGRYGKLGFGVSHVRFPSGSISTTQPYLLYEYSFNSLLGNGWDRGASGGSASAAPFGMASNAQEFSLVARSYRIPSSVVQDGGQPQHHSMQLLGVEWLSYLDDRWFLKLEAEGAVGGKSNGYMQILAGGGYRLPLTSSTAIKLHAAAGPAGGGNVDTGGGLLLDAGISLQQKLTQRTALELSVGELRAPSKSFKAQSVALKLNYQFGLPAATSATVPWSALDGFDSVPLRLRTVTQNYLKNSPNWRSSNVDQSVGNLGMQVDYFVSPNWFLTGQALAAYSGKAGGYMTGLVGAGGQLPVSDRWFVEGEALLGAAGGGGLAMGGGLVGQANASLGYRLSKSLSVMATAGHMSALRGDFKAKVVGVSLAYQFTGLAEK
ncbi:hypothetical protein N0K08_16790 [Acidovorax sp. Be4]|uniref:Uncharacterized protein n=2 Tax=Acidovorax bellezanensis TaxID=2976702 RepID=A0ABT2PSW5_9BURK|nr:hypothetical protein [Acidovorax sp. Be4]